MSKCCSPNSLDASQRFLDGMQRYVIDPLTAALLYAVYYGVRALPVDWASAIGSRLAVLIGPLLPVQKIARQNLAEAFPEKTEAEIAAILRGMWDNIGRTFFEYPHQKNLLDMGRVEFVGAEHIEAIRDDERSGLLWGAHLGNWEMLANTAAQFDLELHRIYRRPNNPHIEKLFRADRDRIKGELLPKGAQGARRAMMLLKKGGHLAMLVDQKMNDGISVPFFGRPAMTAPALAAFALRFKCPVVPCRVIRLHGAHFRVEAETPYTFDETGNRTLDEFHAMKQVNQRLEDWIRERPEQWLWVHRRWPKPGSHVPPYNDGSDDRENDLSEKD